MASNSKSKIIQFCTVISTWSRWQAVVSTPRYGGCLFIRRLRRRVIFSNIPILMMDVGQENSIKHFHSEKRITGHSRHCSIAMPKSQSILHHDCILIPPPRMFSVGCDTTLQEIFFPPYPLWPKLKWTPENVVSCGSSIVLSTLLRRGEAVVVLRFVPSLCQARGSWGSIILSKLLLCYYLILPAPNTSRHTHISFINKSPICYISLLSCSHVTLDLIEGISIHPLSLCPPHTFCPIEVTWTFTRRYINTSRDWKMDVTSTALI